MMFQYQQFRNFSIGLKNYCKFEKSVVFSNKRKLKFNTGALAKMTDGAVVASVGATSVLVTAVSKIKSGPSPGFMPLTVDYRQKYVAAGRIPSNYMRRELAPTEKEILTGRAIDRSIRPLFPSGFYNDTQLSCQLLAIDSLQDPDVISINAASAALAISDIPWNGPVGSVRVGFIDGQVVIFPDRRELANSSLNLIITACKKNSIVMLEGSGSPVLLQDLKKAIRIGVQECQKIIASIAELAKSCGKPKRSFKKADGVSEEILNATKSLSVNRIREVLKDFSHNKLSRDNALNDIRLDVIEKLTDEFQDSPHSDLNISYNQVTKDVFRNLILEEQTRCDGRSLHQLRPISCSIDLFKPLHGSSLFQRGQTQVQCTVAYDSPEKALSIDPLHQITWGGKDRNFFLHYSFPSFANNELPRGFGVSRREIGHGALACKSLSPLIPKDFPFTVLLSATVMESNGSSSMATVCGGSLALMDAGINISAPASGVAIGLVSNSNEEDEIIDYKILTDILGIEDYLGDMDFKVAGPRKGITAIQADVKLSSGVPSKMIMEALDRSFDAKNQILEIMSGVICEPKKNKSNLPVISTREVPQNKRGRLMGSGGVNFRKLKAETGVELNWVDNTNLSIFAHNQENMTEAMELVDQLLQEDPELEFGSIYTAVIKEILPHGVLVSLFEGMTPALLHNSQLDVKKVQHASMLNLEVGQEIKVKYFGLDPTSGQLRLSRRALQSTLAPPGIKNFLDKEN